MIEFLSGDGLVVALVVLCLLVIGALGANC